LVSRDTLHTTNPLERLSLSLANTTGSITSAKSIRDFLKSQHINMAPNQVQAALRMDREETGPYAFGKLEKIQDNSPKVLVTLDQPYDNPLQGIEQLSLRDFLMMALSGKGWRTFPPNRLTPRFRYFGFPILNTKKIPCDGSASPSMEQQPF